MKNLILKNILPLTTIMGGIIGIYMIVCWSSMPVIQRLTGFIILGLVLHLWEEGKFPGGFSEMITDKLKFTAKNKHFGELITTLLIVVLAVIPFCFPNVMFLAIAPMILGVIEAVAHLAAMKMYTKKRFYSPGLVTALVVLLPISIYSFVYSAKNHLMRPEYWLYAILFMFVGLVLAQRIVISSSGMKYSEFLKNVRSTLFTKHK